METYVVDGATLSCTLGTQKSKLKLPKGHDVFLRHKKQANASDHISIANIKSFGNCIRTSPPPVCIPATNSNWTKIKDDVFIDKDEALIKSSICSCSLGGVISITNDGQ